MQDMKGHFLPSNHQYFPSEEYVVPRIFIVPMYYAGRDITFVHQSKPAIAVPHKVVHLFGIC